MTSVAVGNVFIAEFTRFHGRRHVSPIEYCLFFPRRIEEFFEDTI